MKTRAASLFAGACAALALTASTALAASGSGASSSAGPNPSRQSWAADGWRASITHADGTAEQAPNLSGLSASAPAASNKPAADPREAAETIPGRQWRREKGRTTTAYYGPEEAGHPQYDHLPEIRAAWLPEGWELESIDAWDLTDQICHWNFRRDSAKLELTCYRRSAGYIGMSLFDKNAPYESRRTSPAVELQQVQVGGRSADFYQAGSTAYLFWENSGGDLFALVGDLDQAAMTRVADGVAEAKDQALPEYQLGWEPKGAKTVRRYSVPGAVMTCAGEESPSVAGPSFYTWLYASEPLSVPEGTPEAVKVRGAEAQYWKGALEAEPFSDKALFAAEEERSVLLWKDPKTNLTFRIQGVLSKDTLIRMAESAFLK